MAEPVFLYDGDCSFCTSCVRFLERHTRVTVPIEPWQRVDLAPLGVTAEECAESVQWVRPGERPRSGPDAIARLLRTDRGRPGLWRLAGVILSLPPVLWLARPVYRLISRNRHRLPGGTPTCALPRGLELLTVPRFHSEEL